MFTRFFRWLRNRIAKRRNDRHRLLFSFYDGKEIRRVDPMKVWRAIRDDEKFNPSTMGELVDRQEEPETTWCYNCVCNAFGVKRYDEKTDTGLTDIELLDLLGSFWDYLTSLQKKTRNGPISPAPTESTPSVSTADPAETTKLSAGSGSTSSEPRNGSPTESCEPSEPLTATR